MNTTTKPEATALVTAPTQGSMTIQRPQQFDLSPQTFDQALIFADYLAASDMVPKAYRNRPGDCLIAMQWGYEIGLKPLQALQSIATINGKPGLFGDAGKALLLSLGCIIEEDDIEIIKQTGKGRCKITRPGRPPTERTFSTNDAERAGLWGKEGPWKTYPYRQMAWRAFWFAARDAASDLLRGLSGAEELADYQTEPKAVQGQAPTPTQQQQPGLQPWPDADLDKRKAKVPEWQKAGKSAEEVIVFMGAKGVLSDEQKARIRSWFAASAESGAPAVSYDALAARLNALTSDDAEAAALVLDEGRALPAEQFKALTGLYEAKFPQFPQE